MLFAAFCVVFARILVLSAASSTSSGPSLSLRIFGPQRVEGDEHLILTTVITNTGDELLKLLNDPRSPLSNAATDTFDIKDSAGKKALFTGIEADHDPFEMAVNRGQDDFLILGPGESVNVDHNCMYARD
jgi:peptidyl-Lys metalloendopeptidase